MIFLVIQLCLLAPVFAQEDEELIGFDFTHSGKGEYEDEKMSSQKYDLRINLPVVTKKKDTYLMHGLELGRSNIKFGNSLAKNAKLNRFYKVAYTFSYMRPIKKNWYLMAGAGPYVYSNFDSGLTSKDIKGTGYLILSKPTGKRDHNELIIGVVYHPSLGFGIPIPLVGFNWRPDERWNINLGFPDFSIEYKPGKNTRIGTNLFINGDEFTLSNKDRIFQVGREHLPDLTKDVKDVEVDKFSYTEYGLGLHVKQKFLKNFQARINTGYSFSREFEFKDEKNKLLTIEPKDKYFVQVGVSFLM